MPQVLRFKAKLLNGDETDRARDFVINYFMVDNEVSVFEPPIRNSGIVGGLFLKRRRYKKYIDASGVEMMAGSGKGGHGGCLSRWLRPSDFYDGAEIIFEMPSSGTKLYKFKIMVCKLAIPLLTCVL